MKKKWWLLGIIGLFAIWALRSHPPHSTHPQEINPSTPKTPILADSITEPKRKTSPSSLETDSPKLSLLNEKSPSPNRFIQPQASAPSKDAPTNPYKSPTETITYEIYQDWAIAYGDVLLGKVEGAGSLKQGQHRPERPLLWDSNVIPFGVHPNLTRVERVKEAISYFNQYTSVRFVPVQEGDPDALIFIPDDQNCASYLGRIGGMQPIMVAPKCQSQDLIHELMHALGFVHEHSRKDRDRYVEIIWDRIDPKYWPQFALVPDNLIHEYRGSVFDFDPQSAMLYPPTAFAKIPGQVTLRARGSAPLHPTTVGLSSVDLERLSYLYGSGG